MNIKRLMEIGSYHGMPPPPQPPRARPAHSTPMRATRKGPRRALIRPEAAAPKP